MHYLVLPPQEIKAAHKEGMTSSDTNGMKVDMTHSPQSVEDVVREFTRNWGQPEFRNLEAIEPFLRQKTSSLLTAIIGEIEAGKKDESVSEREIDKVAGSFWNIAKDEDIALILQRLEV